jgi:hypothetical protein
MCPKKQSINPMEQAIQVLNGLQDRIFQLCKLSDSEIQLDAKTVRKKVKKNKIKKVNISLQITNGSKLSKKIKEDYGELSPTFVEKEVFPILDKIILSAQP